jgi:hypothetical protein
LAVDALASVNHPEHNILVSGLHPQFSPFVDHHQTERSHVGLFTNAQNIEISGGSFVRVLSYLVEK